MHGSARAVHGVGEQERGDQPGRPGRQAHHDDQGSVESADQQSRPTGPDPPADQTGQGRPDGEQPPGRGRHRTHEGARPCLPARQLGEPDRHERLEGDHPNRPEHLDEHEGTQHRGRGQRAQAAGDGARCVARGAQRPSDRRRADVGPVLAHPHGDRHEVDDVEPEREPAGQLQRGHRGNRVPRHEGSRDQRARGDRDAERSTCVREGGLDPDVRVVGLGGVDVPGLEGAGVQSAEQSLQHEREHEGAERVCGDEGQARDQRDRAGGKQHRPPAERVGEPPGGELETEHDKALHRQDDADLGQAHAALEREQRRDPDREADREPAGDGQQQQGPAGCVGGDSASAHRARGGASRSVG